MGFLRRLLGREDPASDVSTPATDPGALDAEERAHELEMLQAEQDRLDALAQRQLRYAQYAWQPPAQGGERRADDGEKPQS